MFVYAFVLILGLNPGAVPCIAAPLAFFMLFIYLFGVPNKALLH